MNLLNISGNAKTIKSDKSGKGYLTGILYLSPAKTSGFQTCPNSSKGCRASCLFTAGRGRMNNVHNARVRKTKLFFENRVEFAKLLREDLVKFSKKCESLNVTPALRLNGTSDIPFIKDRVIAPILKEFPNITQYDYTKRQSYFSEYMAGKLPDNINLTFSRSEHNWDFCKTVLKEGFNCAVVFDKLPETYEDYPVFNGDQTDLRFLDPDGICGLTAKGKAKHDTTQFVIRTS